MITTLKQGNPPYRVAYRGTCHGCGAEYSINDRRDIKMYESYNRRPVLENNWAWEHGAKYIPCQMDWCGRKVPVGPIPSDE